jgi:hypothetical protein
MLPPGSGTFNPALHPRQGGGRFGQSNAHQQEVNKEHLKAQLKSRADVFREDAARIRQQIDQLRQQVSSLHTTAHHTAVSTKSRSKQHTTKTAKGSKSGLAKKTGKTTTKKATSSASSTATKISVLRAKIHQLRVQENELLKRATL